MYLPSLDTNTEEGRQQAEVISHICKAEFEEMLKLDAVSNDFRSRLSCEPDVANYIPSTWLSVLGLYDTWFKRNKELLLRDYYGQHVAIANFSVVDSDRSFGVLVRRVRKKYGANAVLISEVREESFSDEPYDHLIIGFRD